jgi:glycosyltransferase involved in cell wall biosynthesis
MVPFVLDMLDVYGARARDVFIVAIAHHQASTAVGLKIARVIHHGIDAADVPVGRGLGGYVCFLGRMDPNKGVLEAVRIARRAGLPLRIAAKMHKAAERDYFDTAIRPPRPGDGLSG